MSIDEIHEICKIYKIVNYTINDDMSIDVNDNVNLFKLNLSELPLTFNIVNGKGNFNIMKAGLSTLKGSPREITSSFYCQFNNITDLSGGPDKVSYLYSCRNNENLTSLKGLASHIDGSLNLSNCGLRDFKGVPENIYLGGSINFYNNPVYFSLGNFLEKYDIDINTIKDKYLELILEINDLDAIQDGEIIDMRMDEVLYNIGLI